MHWSQLWHHYHHMLLQAKTHGLFYRWLKNSSVIVCHTFTHFPHGSLFPNKQRHEAGRGLNRMTSRFPEITRFCLTAVTFHRSADRVVPTQEPANYVLMTSKHFGWMFKHIWHHFIFALLLKNSCDWNSFYSIMPANLHFCIFKLACQVHLWHIQQPMAFIIMVFC